MKKVLLIHQNKIQHYRISIYDYLSDFLKNYGYGLIIVADGIEKGNPYPIDFEFFKIKLKTLNLVVQINKIKPDAIIFFVNLKNLYLFPVLLYAKLYNIRTIYWGPARDLEDKDNSIKNLVYTMEHWLTDAILLYADYLKQYVRPKFYYKTFVANNTLNTTGYKDLKNDKEATLAKYEIKTTKNIICMGRMQKRKRIEDLVQAFKKLNRDDVGLVLAGPDTDGILNNLQGKNIYKVGPVYGEEAIKLLSSCDIYCLPGHIGLSIVDAFYCGLPLITEKVDHAPEISYLKDGVNGFMIPKGDVDELANKLGLLLDDETIRMRFSKSARNEINSNGHIKKMSEGFLSALDFVFT